MTFTGRELAAVVTVDDTWTQMEDHGSSYEVASDGRPQIVKLSAFSLGPDPVEVDFAISSDSSISSAERIEYTVNLTTTSRYCVSETPYVMIPGERLYVKAIGTTVNVIFRATLKGLT
jgi:hypothetical protein